VIETNQMATFSEFYSSLKNMTYKNMSVGKGRVCRISKIVWNSMTLHERLNFKKNLNPIRKNIRSMIEKENKENEKKENEKKEKVKQDYTEQENILRNMLLTCDEITLKSLIWVLSRPELCSIKN